MQLYTNKNNPHLHRQDEMHHNHSHAHTSHHGGGHHLLNIEGLCVSFDMYDTASPTWSGKRRVTPALRDLSLSVHNGEILAVVGASGAGKSVLADAILGLYAKNSLVTGTIYFDGTMQDAQSLARLRGHKIAYIPQGTSALDPMMRIGKQIGGGAGARQALYKKYNLPPQIERMYPHELSGGMARRALLLTALIGNPQLIVADEPTPGLDLDLAVYAMQDFRAFANGGGAAVLITHDIELALTVADRVAIFKDGTIVEETATANFSAPDTLRTHYARTLWHALPTHDFTANAKAKGEGEGGGKLACACAAASESHLLQSRNLSFDYCESGTKIRNDALLSHVDFSIATGERVVVQGASGRGKTTFCKLLAGYLTPTSGAVLLDGMPTPTFHKKRACPVQLIHQSPERALDPRVRIGTSLAESGLKITGDIARALGIDPEWGSRFPLELSGGQLQRICIARAIATRPQFLIADEISTMLDALTQAQIWEFLLDWQRQTGAGLIITTHSPALANRLATRVFAL